MPRPAMSRAPLDSTLHYLLQRYTMHDLLHTLVECCYREAGREEDRTHGDVYTESQWREVARHLTSVELAVAHLELR